MSEARSWEEFFENFSYKPNFEFDYKYEKYEVNEWLKYKVIITMRVPDSRRPLPDPETLVNGIRQVIPLVPITNTVLLYKWPDEKEALSRMRWEIRTMEDHEIDEWLKYNGELPFDPHKKVS